MKVVVVLFAVVAAVSAAALSTSYIPPVADISLPIQEYIPPESNDEPNILADDGYRYKVARKLKLRQRRDVNELPTSEYLPPVKEGHEKVTEEVTDLKAVPEEKTALVEDGYRYMTVRRLKYRHRRDVNELPVTEYLPTTASEHPVSEEVSVDESVPEVKTELADDGYHYKTVRRLKYRQRRDVSELPASQYLPPTEINQEEVAVAQPASEEVSVDESVPEVKTELADDGYRYKTVRRLKYRQRRDVSELPASQYLPPTEINQDEVAVAQPVSEEVLVDESVPEVKTELADEGYRYKTVRRLKYRQRRDVSELPASQYLPPSEINQDEVAVAQPVSEEVAVDESVPEVKTELADDGYRYKTLRRLKYRQRRDVGELPASQYLPPTEINQDEVAVAQPVSEEVAVDESVPEVKTELDDDGYRYKTIRRLKYRQRRDVGELPASQYLPPTEINQDEVAVAQPVSEEVAVDESVPEVKTELADDGYRYKTVRRLKYRQRRDVSELPASQYLPPTEINQDEVAVAQPVSEEVAVDESVPEVKTELADDGYRYKTVRRLKYRQRRDVSELPASQYLPPTEINQDEVAVAQPVSEEVAVDESVPEVKTELADDGYRYKTVRRLKYRQRRDVSELPASQYLPPTEINQDEVAVAQPVSEEVAVDESVPEVKTELADDGYRYKTVRRLKYRQRRDVGELPASQYLPPTEINQDEVAVAQPVSEEVAVDESVPEVKTELADDGYRYKTVRRLKYRQRRDVSELPASQYLPPTEINQDEVAVAQPVSEEVAVDESVPEVKTELADDGYRYKTVRRLKYRQRRDVSELPASQYLPPTEINQEEIAVAQPVSEEVAVDESVPEVKTELADDGYRYKTVRRLKYRQRRDVSELPASQYLPPTEINQDEVAVAQPVSEEVPVDESVPEVKTELADDGYRYKTVRRLKYRQRRDVSELPASQYLPPTEINQDEVAVAQPVSEEVPVDESVPEVKTELADDGYRYKTVRRLKYRQRRDVSELPASQYLPPTEINQKEVAVAQPVSEEVSVDESVPEVKTELADDGYRYKTVRRLKYRQRRDVSELPASQYLPPTEINQDEVAVAQPVSEEVPVDESVPEVKTELADDGYRYKTVRRLKYRQRRDVSELPASQYLPPTEINQDEVAVAQPVSEEVSVDESVPEVKTELADDGYRYKTVRRLKYRQRRDVNESPATEYLPPIELEQPVSEEVSVAESLPEKETKLTNDGYRYKTVRRIKYRSH